MRSGFKHGIFNMKLCMSNVNANRPNAPIFLRYTRREPTHDGSHWFSQDLSLNHYATLKVNPVVHVSQAPLHPHHL